MNIKLSKNKNFTVKKGKRIDKNVARQFIEIQKGIRAFYKKEYGKSIQYLEKKAMNPNATERIKFIVGTSYTEIKAHEKEASELLKSIIQKYKDEPKEKRPQIYTWSILEYAKIQVRDERAEFAIYLLEDIPDSQQKQDIDILIELAKAYDMEAQESRRKKKYEEALETDQKTEEICMKCIELSEKDDNLKLKSIIPRNILGILYIRQGELEKAQKQFEKIGEISPEDKKTLNSKESMNLLKETYFTEETEEEANKRIKKFERKMELIEKEKEKKECEREINLIDRTEFFEELSEDVKVYKGVDIFVGYKMYEYPLRGIFVIDKLFSETKNEEKVYGFTYIFPQILEFNIKKLSRDNVIKMFENEKMVQKQEHKGDYYNLVQEKMKRAELEGLIIEEKILKEKEKKLDLSST